MAIPPVSDAEPFAKQASFILRMAFFDRVFFSFEKPRDSLLATATEESVSG